MKIFNKNLILVLVAVTLVFTACKQEAIEPLPHSGNVEYDLENAPFKKEIVTESKDGIFTFQLSSNSSDVLDAFDNESVSFVFLDEATIKGLKSEEASASDQSQTDNDDYDTAEKSFNGPEFIGISLVKIETKNGFDHIPPYELGLSQAALEVLRSKKIATVFDFQPNVELNGSSSRNKTLWSNNQLVLLRGDCGSYWSVTDHFWARTGQNNRYFLSGSGFLCGNYISPCGKGSDAWIRRVNVVADVVPRIIGLSSTECQWSNYSKTNVFGFNCSGWYPNGCRG